jgi:SAM-dependent methyltransferase
MQYATVYRVARGEVFSGPVPIGRPLSNTVAFILDSKQRLVPVGVAGDLYLGGEGLARGYGDAEQTSKSFVSILLQGREQRLYRTGDRARWRATDGAMEFLGRKDHQIKLRGQRIELGPWPSFLRISLSDRVVCTGEIESVLRLHPSVRDSFVLLHSTSTKEQYIAAFVTPTDTASVTTDDDSGQEEGERVQGWSEIFDGSTYKSIETKPGLTLGRDFVGWTSMFDGKEIPRPEMEDWLDDTVGLILESGPVENVVEIGTGTGMILFNLKDFFEHYTGVDLSAKAIHFIQDMASRYPSLREKIDVRTGSAEDILSMDVAQPDVFIINSVAQYFPSADYLRATILNAVAAANGRPSRMILGDIRSLSLTDEFFSAWALRDLRKEGAPSLSSSDILHRARHLLNSHSELLVHPSFFAELQREFSSTIVHFAIRPKCMVATNELSQYRYQVILWFNSVPEVITIPSSDWIDFKAEAWTKERLQAVLRSLLAGEALAICNIPNARLYTERKLLQSLSKVQKGEWPNELEIENTQSDTSFHPHELKAVAKSLGLQVELSWTRQSSIDGGFDAVFSSVGESKALFRFPALPPVTSFATKPVKQVSHIEQINLSKIKDFIRNRLPMYMVPSRIQAVSELPMTVNGKVDRRALLELLPVVDRSETGVQYVAPRSSAEAIVISVFEDVLGETGLSITSRYVDSCPRFLSTNYSKQINAFMIASSMWGAIHSWRRRSRLDCGDASASQSVCAIYSMLQALSN